MTEQERAERGWPSTARVAFEHGPFAGGAGAILTGAQSEVGLWMATDSPGERRGSTGPLSASPGLCEGEGPGCIGEQGE